MPIRYQPGYLIRVLIPYQAPIGNWYSDVIPVRLPCTLLLLLALAVPQLVF